MPDETLANFKVYVARLLSLSTDDPNLGVTIAGDALAVIHAYAAGRLTWTEFVTRAEAIARAFE